MSTSGRCALVTCTPAWRQGSRNRIVIPRLLTTTPQGTSPEVRASAEYHAHKHVPRHTADFLGREGAAALNRQEQLSRFHIATAAAVEGVWRDSKPHLRRQQELVDQLGLEGAVRETLHPSTTSFRQQLRSRPLDRGILEEIYLGLHGKRIERRLKRGVSWEHWITKGDGTAPVYTTSRKGQQTFAFGGSVRQVVAATHPQQFPTVQLPTSSSLQARSGSKGGRSSSPSRCGRRGGAIVDCDTLVPEVAFIGRTSSGKSSLINAILNATVAPYGHLQGTTSAVHFYSVANKVMLVDCPGYGYYNPMQTPTLDAESAVRVMRAYLRSGARRQRKPKRRSEAEGCDTKDTEGVRKHSQAPSSSATGTADRRSYATPITASATPKVPHGTNHDMNDDYEGEEGHGRVRLVQQRNLKRVFVCVPAKGMQHADVEYCRLLEQLGIPFSVVFTKTDGSPIRMLARLADYTRSQLVQYDQCKELMLTSALRLAGIDKMQSLIGSMSVTEDRMNGAALDFTSIV